MALQLMFGAAIGAPLPLVIANSGFETPVLGSSTYNPAGAGWTLVSVSGIAISGDTGFLATAPPQGTQVAFLQGGSYVYQQLTGLIPGVTYQVRFRAAQSPTQPGSTISIQIDGVQIGTYTATSSTSFDTATKQFTATQPTHTLLFQEIAGPGHCTTIDDVHVDVVFGATTLPNCILYAEADALTGYADSAPVPTWTDASAAGNSLTQATTANQPLYKTNILNGKPVLRFDGVNDYYTAAITKSQPLTVVALFKTTVTSSNCIWDSGNAVTRFALQGDGTSEGMYAGNALNSIGVFDTTAFHINTAIYNGATSGLRRDGVVRSAGDAGTQGPVGLVLGCNVVFGSFAPMDMAVIAMYPRALSAAEANSIGLAWATKYGLTYTPY